MSLDYSLENKKNKRIRYPQQSCIELNVTTYSVANKKRTATERKRSKLCYSFTAQDLNNKDSPIQKPSSSGVIFYFKKVDSAIDLSSTVDLYAQYSTSHATLSTTRKKKKRGGFSKLFRRKEKRCTDTRFSMDTERAMYRLSYTKLTNPERSLHDQVIISNLMYWYLSIVARPHAPLSKVATCRIEQLNKTRKDVANRV
ncbi:Putative Protein ZDS1 [Rhizopus microsporus]|nr:Putative Protein ZDS1 [Rhizopus microsporus]